MPMGQQDNTRLGDASPALAAPDAASQIDRVPAISGAPRAPYALEPAVFPFPALAALAGRASMGGPREIALACLLAGRLVLEVLSGPGALTSDQRRTRAQGAKSWLGSAAIPAPVRTALGKLVEATAGDGSGPLKAALESVMTVTANHLDSAARLELARLAQTIAE